MTIDYRSKYGADRIVGPDVYWSDPELAKITRLRLLTAGLPYWDVSYCYGVRKDGTHCRVSLPFYQLPKRLRSAKIVEYARAEGVYAMRLGLFDPMVISEVK